MANKLELTWYGKENEIKVEPRILIEDSASAMRCKTKRPSLQIAFSQLSLRDY